MFVGAGLSCGRSSLASATKVSCGEVVVVPSGLLMEPSSAVGLPLSLRKLCSLEAEGRLLIFSVWALQCFVFVVLISFLYSVWPCLYKFQSWSVFSLRAFLCIILIDLLFCVSSNVHHGADVLLRDIFSGHAELNAMFRRFVILSLILFRKVVLPSGE